MKNAFLCWKLISFLRWYLHFCPDFKVMQKNESLRKQMLISKILNSYNTHIVQ